MRFPDGSPSQPGRPQRGGSKTERPATPRPQPDLLIADLGGTNLRIARRDGRGRTVLLGRFATHEVGDLPDLLRRVWLKAAGRVPAALAIAVAGPIDHGAGQARLTNHPALAISSAAIARALGLRGIAMVNDLAAQAMGLALGAGGTREMVAPGTPDDEAPRLLIGLGTGFGTALILPGRGGLPQVVPAEGGHVTLAAETAAEWAVIEAARPLPGTAGVNDHVSAEDLVSGHGLPRLAAAVAAVRGLAPVRGEAEAVTEAALAGDAGAREAFELFSGWAGAVAGDLAIATGARGGVVLSGDLLHRLGGLFDRRRAAARFRAKGRFSAYLANVPLELAPAGDDLAFAGLTGIADAVAAREAGPVFD
ncbi:glucokinase [Tistrella mobilis]|uniref:glucokinase n=1 Tax=Tistrella mobilis TaxID=171437 RepID=UPI003556A7B1